MKNNKGFTLIELIMVTIILGILAAVAVPRYMGTVNQAEAAAEKAVVDALRAAVENYSTQEFLEEGRYDYPSNPFTLVDVDGYDDMVLEKNISFESHCEHHMAPIIGIAHVAYIPNERVVGLSKLARVVEVFSKRLQTQERLTMQIASTLMKALDAKGVAVTIDAAHQCMTMRGIKKERATTVTNYFLGSFKEDLSIQNRYLRYIAK